MVVRNDGFCRASRAFWCASRRFGFVNINKAAAEEKGKILFFTAFIGDFGLSDMGYRAVQEIAEQYNLEWTLVEYGAYDPALAINSYWDGVNF